MENFASLAERSHPKSAGMAKSAFFHVRVVESLRDVAMRIFPAECLAKGVDIMSIMAIVFINLRQAGPTMIKL
jgi:hypothetical protein